MMWVSLDDELWELWGALGIASRNYKHLWCFCPTVVIIELVHLSFICAPYASYPLSSGLMGSTSHLGNEVGKARD